MIWSGDEVAALNDPDWASVPEHADDNRWAHRPALDWGRVQQARAEPESPIGRVLTGLRHLARVRTTLPHLHAGVAPELVATPDPGVFAVVRRHPVGPMIGLYNITEQPRTVPAWWVREHGLQLEHAQDALNGYPPNLSPDGSVHLSTYQPVWLVH
ncbi:hypothetical protein [Ornithinimicrobium pratense]|uniref:hypothetical protein n=1 Tax=Ornithinimicrobium pratense TaxID=2593973 RepID=UPI001EE1F7C9|nr:hypothetical protein [Ornithinimicrobium pratense]